MWKEIIVGVDNSIYSLWAVDAAIALGKSFEGTITGCHVYAVRLHDSRFRAMEYTLPGKYLKDSELERQRQVHNLLIEKGMKVISDSYLAIVEKKCVDGGVGFRPLSLEGKNYRRLVEETNRGEYGLLCLGVRGVGAVDDRGIGSVALRSARRIRKDMLVVKKEGGFRKADRIVVCVDGSLKGYGAVAAGMELSARFGMELHLVAVYDPYFHTVIFRSLSRVLSEEGAKIFRFKEQEELHEKIIDDGLARIYGSYLNVARHMAESRGVEVSVHLLAGKSYEKIKELVEEIEPFLVVCGRTGSHAEDDADIGSTAENLLFECHANLLFMENEVCPPEGILKEETLKWTEEAKELMNKVPGFARGMAKNAIENYGKERGHTVITSSVIKEAMEEMMPGHTETKDLPDE